MSFSYHAASKGVGHSLVQVFLAEVTLRDVQERPQGSGKAIRTMRIRVLVVQPSLVQDAVPWGLFAEDGRHGEMDLSGHDVAKLVKGKSGFMGNHCLRFILPITTPKCQTDQIRSIRRRIVAQTIDAVTFPDPVSVRAVEMLKRVAVAGFEGLMGCKEPSLVSGNVHKLLSHVSSWCHAQTLN
jgi:hypothetical protein